ncbi:Protein of unknown function [Paraburkholderia steynii]|uniref:DUF3348 domain-containing protein n=2 Tax=Paraburkholderia steynii TaxID=1245441 RepID=A0A7Z7FEU1_9BURK|nr:Protein of unknown function [Paraburkholderia steynii]
MVSGGMVQAPQRTAVSGPTLVRLLARLTAADVPASSQSLSDQLSQWLGWTDAIALSTALNSAPPAVASGARGAGSVEHECARVRASLADAIAGDSMLAPRRRRSAAQVHAQNAQQPEAEANYADFRQCYLALQQSMETRIGSLRGRLRSMVAAQTSEMTRLAVVDAIMERSLGARERSLFGAVPGLLSGHFERLRQAAQDERDALDAVATTATSAERQVAAARPGAWLDVFRKDMQSVLLAELDIRFQPVEGLLAALRIS